MSGKSLAERLQIKRGRLWASIGATAELDALVGAPDERADPADADVVLMVVRDHAGLVAALGTDARALRPTTILWITYPKLSSRLAGELNRDMIRAIAPGYGLGPVSQIAIDETWSALRLKRIT